MDVKITGIDEAIREAREIQARLRHQRPAMDEVAKQIKTFIEERFHERTSPDGRAWAPVTLNTAKYRETDGLGLMRSRYATAYSSRVRYGAKASFADVHQLGDGRVPARPYAPAEGEGGPSDELIAKLREMIERYLVTGEIGWR